MGQRRPRACSGGYYRAAGRQDSAFIDNNADAKPAIKDIPLVIGEEGFKKWAALNNAL